MLVRLLHGALALSLATEPAAAGDEPVPTERDDDSSATPPSDASEPEPEPESAQPETETDPAPEPDPATPEPEPEPEPTPEPEPESEAAVPPVVATEPPRPVIGPPSSGRKGDLVSKALLGGGIASLTLTAGLVGTSAWAWTESNRAERASKNLTDDPQADAQDRRDQMRTIGLITTGAAALYGTTGVVLLLLRARDRRPAPRTVLAPSPGGLSLTGRF
ncbi:MAG: hypothetical protein ACE37F_05620 [Nannocystaceae bacterium]|nr:hypothetical protein [bacterium]